MFPMTITLHSSAQLNAVLRALRSNDQAEAPAPAVAAPAAQVETSSKLTALLADAYRLGLNEEGLPGQVVGERAFEMQKGLYITDADAVKAEWARGVGDAMKRKREAAAAPQGEPQPASTPAVTPAPAAPTPPTAEAVAAAAPVKTAAESAPPAAPAAAEPQASTAAAEPIPYTVVGALITECAKSHRAAVVSVLKDFGATNGKGLKPEQYAPFMAALKSAVGV